jgi:nucleotide-binding universal stress UspA family protein
VSAWWPDQSELPPAIADGEHERAHARVTDWCRPLREAGVAHQGRPIEGEARQVLAREVERTRPDLAVIGARRPEAGVAFGLGSVTHHLTHPLRVPLAVVPGADFGTGPLVAGVDGSKANRPALRWAAALALQLARPIEAVYAAPPKFPTGGLDPAGEVRIRAGHDHVPLLVVTDEDPRSAVERIASRDHAGAIIVGSHGGGGLHGLMLGKVTHELLRHSSRPVIVVPHDHDVHLRRERYDRYRPREVAPHGNSPSGPV